MPEERTRFEVLNRALAAIEETDADLAKAQSLSDGRVKTFCTFLEAREALEDTRAVLHATTERATGVFLREAAKHDVAHGIHKTELRIATSRSRAVIESLPWLRNLSAASDVASACGHVSRSRWRGRVVEQLNAFESAVREPIERGGLGLTDETDLVVGLRVLWRSVNACTGTDAVRALRKLQARSIELAAAADPDHFGKIEATREEARRRFVGTLEVEKTRAKSVFPVKDRVELNKVRASYKERVQDARAARHALLTDEADGDALLDFAPPSRTPSRKKLAPRSTAAPPTEVLLARHGLATATYLPSAALERPSFFGGENDDDAAAAWKPSARVAASLEAVDAYLAEPAPKIPKRRVESPLDARVDEDEARHVTRRAAPGTLSTKTSRSAATLAAFARPNAQKRDLAADCALLGRLTVTKVDEAAVNEACHRFLVECSIAGEWKLALKGYRAQVGKGLAPTDRTWRVLLRACKIGHAPPAHAFAILEEIEAQTCARSGRDGLVDVSVYNAVIDICGAAGAWRRALQVFNRLRHHGIAPNTHTYSCIMAAAVGVNADSTEVYEGLKYAGIPEYIAYTAATAHALSWRPTKTKEDKLRITNRSRRHSLDAGPRQPNPAGSAAPKKAPS